MAGHSPSKTGVNALFARHPRLIILAKVVEARHKAGHDRVNGYLGTE
jgi:hypothetical protein